MKLRRATEQDLDIVCNLGKRTYRDHFSDVWSEAGLAAYLRDQFDPKRVRAELQSDATFYFVIDAPGPVGIAKVLANRPMPAKEPVRGWELQKIYLLSSETGKRHGGLALEALAIRAREASARCLWLDVLKSNTRGVRFYERQGFQTVGELPFATDLREIGLWVMRKDL